MSTDLLPATKSFERWSGLLDAIRTVSSDKKSQFHFRITGNNQFELGIIHKGNWVSLDYRGVGASELCDALNNGMDALMVEWSGYIDMRLQRERVAAQAELKKIGLID